MTKTSAFLTSNPRTGEPVIYDRDKVAERWKGLSPAQIVDLKALQGDSSDNIPGVPGIGEKTAVTLLGRYGTVENVLDHVEELPGRPRKALQSEQNRELARLSKDLATIVTDLPIEFDLEDAKLWNPDAGSVRELFLDLEFRSLLNRLPFVVEQDASDKQLGLFGGGQAAAPETEVVTDAASARKLVAALEAAESAGSVRGHRGDHRGPGFARSRLRDGRGKVVVRQRGGQGRQPRRRDTGRHQTVAGRPAATQRSRMT